jgi:hypothetical protein
MNHEKIGQIARVCHEANRAYCECIGDHSQPSWADAPQWQRNSALDGVLIRIKDPQSSPAEQHEKWCADKLENGWKFGPVKDAEKKEHPCLVDYDQLPQEQQKKDALFIAIVDALK